MSNARIYENVVIGALGMWFIADSFLITLVALCTFDVGDWGTRGTPGKKT